MPGAGVDGSRLTVSENEVERFCIRFVAARRWGFILFMSLWMCGWAMGENAAFATLFLGRPMMKGGASPFLAFWLIHWTVGGLVIGTALLWNLAGREIVRIDDALLVLRREVGTLVMSRPYPLERVRNLRYSPLVYNPFSVSNSWSVQLQPLGLAGGPVAFDCAGRTHRFGNGLTETEARRLIATIKQRFKFPDDIDQPWPIAT